MAGHGPARFRGEQLMAWGEKARRIADLEARDKHRVEALHRARRDTESWKWRAQTDAAAYQERETAHRRLRDAYQRLTRHTQHVTAERDTANARVEWLTDQLVTALGYPEAALGTEAPAPTSA